MNNRKHSLGFDRFMALRWVDMALEARLACHDLDVAFRQLKEWLSKEISGKETVRKTATQIRRLWLSKGDQHDFLRQQVITNGLAENTAFWPILHYGLSLNVFPLFWDVCQITGRLLNLQTSCRRDDIYQRIQEIHGNPASTSASTRHVIQTLVDWGFLLVKGKEISAKDICIEEANLTQWLIEALLIARQVGKLPFADLAKSSELLGIRFQDVRSAIRSASHLRIEYTLGFEMICLNDKVIRN